MFYATVRLTHDDPFQPTKIPVDVLKNIVPVAGDAGFDVPEPTII
jgi:hypothetical protein